MNYRGIFVSVFIIIFLGFLFTSIFTWPFVTKLSTYYADWGDYPLVGWILWYNQNSISHEALFNQQKYFQSNQFYPLPYNFAYAEHLIVPSLFFSPIYWLTQNLILSVNTFIFMTFIFNFISSFFVIRYLLDLFHKKFDKAINMDLKIYIASIFGALVYTFNPLTFVHFQGHLQLMNKYFLPPLFLFAFKYLKEPNYKNAFLFFLFFSLNALSSFYFQVFSAISLLFFSLPWLLSNFIMKNKKYFFKLIKTSLISLFFIPILLYFNLPYLEFSTKEGISRTLQENTRYSARLIDWFIPNLNSFIYEKFAYNSLSFRGPFETSGGFNWSEHTLTLNILPMAILVFVIAFFLNKKNKKIRKKILDSHIFRGYISLFLIGIVFTFGPLLFIAGENSSDIKLPYYFLYEYIPLLKGIRAPSRFQFIFYIPFSIFISMGIYMVLKKIKRYGLILVFLLFIGIFLENFIFRSYSEKSYILSHMNNKNIYIKLLINKNTLHLPVNIDNLPKESGYLNWSAITGENILNGYSGYFPSDWYRFMKSLTVKIDVESLKKLKALKIDYIIIHKNTPGLEDGKFPMFLRALGRVYEDEFVYIIDVNKYKFNYNICPNDKDLSIKNLQNKSHVVNNLLFYQISINNPGNCYIANVEMDRYRKVEVGVGKDLYNVSIRLPIIIEPYEKFVINGQIKINKLFNYSK